MLRWSWRDLRRRWGLVLLTAVIIAIGTGTYAGLGGTTPWRLASQDASYDALRYHDLRIVLPDGTDVAQGRLRAATRSIAAADQVAAVTERLSVPIQVDASTAARGGEAVLVPGELVGAPADAAVDALYLDRGRLPTPGDEEVVLETKFVDQRHLPSTGTISISGGRRLQYTGTGVTPEVFSVIGNGQGITGAYGYAVVFASLADVQRLSAKPGRVDDAVLRLRPGADEALVVRQLTAALADAGATVEDRSDDAVRRSLYADARNDEKTWTALSLLILLGASFAAFNLVNRMVEAERHEIGVAMALGAPIRRLALRPLLVGAQIAAAGVVLGIAVGAFAGSLMRGLLVDLLPLPVWHTPFPVGRYAQAAAAGIALPMVATVIPVWRALRVEPVAALRSQAPGSGRRGAGLAPILRRFRLRGHVVAMMPVRNVLRAPRRTVLTALGIGAAITSLVAVLGILDSMDATFARSDREVAGATGDRLEVTLSGFKAANDPAVAAIVDSPVVSAAEPGLRISGVMRHDGHEVETVIDLVDLAHAMWRPTAVRGRLPVGGPGLVISEKAAADLGVGPGDRITLHHPVRDGLSYRLVDSTVTVAAIHPNPLRFFTYLDTSQVGLFDLAGIVDTVVVRPAPGRSADDVKRALFAQQGVGSVQEVAVLGDLIRERVSQFTGILRVLEGFALSLALLIALNSATLTMEERRREQATMFAFGLPVRVVLRSIVVETFLTAVLGTLAGIGGGLLAMQWLLHMFTTETFPELGMSSVLSATSTLTVFVLGVGVATSAPVLAVRRLLRTDIPSTLRVLE
jgi:putative ABC transport system permease protein